MSLLLDEGADVLEAALSFLDAQDGCAGPLDVVVADETPPSRRVKASDHESVEKGQRKPRKKRNYNPNRAREEHRRELQELRSQVPRLEQLLLSLQQEQNANGEPDATVVPTEVLTLRDSWNALVEHEKQTRLHAEQENARLRELVGAQADILQDRMQQLSSTRQVYQRVRPLMQSRTKNQGAFFTADHAWDSILVLTDPAPVPLWIYQDAEPWSAPRHFRPLYPLPISGDDVAMLHELVAGLDAVFHQVNEEVPVGFASLGSSSVPMRMFANGEHRIITDKAFPFEVQTTGAAGWQFFTHLLERQTTRLYYQAQSPCETSGLITGDTIVECFGAGISQSDQKGECRVRQSIRRYVAARRVVIAWRAFVDLIEYEGEPVENARFEEKAALVIEPEEPRNNDGKESSLVRTWQSMAPWHPAGLPHDAAQDERLRKLMDFVVNVCKPGRAMLSMESALSLHARRCSSVH